MEHKKLWIRLRRIRPRPRIEKGCKKAIRPNRELTTRRPMPREKRLELVGLAHIDRSLKWIGLILIYMSATYMPCVYHVGLLMWPPAMRMPHRIADVASSNCS
jgi:hypothetical protein